MERANWRQLAGWSAIGLAATLATRAAVRLSRRIDFTGRSVLITGGSRGLGLTLARRLAAQGAKVALVARDNEALVRAARQLRQLDCDPLLIQADVTEEGAAENAVEQTVARFGRLDILINNAGIVQSAPLEHVTDEDLRRMLDIYIWAPWRFMQAALEPMCDQQFGRIVNISSIGGQLPVPHLAAYATGKHALVGMSETMGIELRKHGIRVTTICPGLMRTGSYRNVELRGQHELELAWFGLGDSLPFVSIDAEKAAHRILQACRYGDPTVTIGLQFKLAKVAHALAPNLSADVLAMVDKLLPKATNSNEMITGWQTTSALAPSRLTQLSDRAAVRNNEGPKIVRGQSV